MRQMRGWPLAALLALAACDRPAPAPAPEPTTNSAEAAPAAATPQVETVPAPAEAAPQTAGFPAALQGRWGMVAEDCRPGSDIAKGLMTVAGDRATFWESRATAGVPEPAGADGWTIDLAFEGEGQTWTTRTTFRLSDGGRALVRTDKGWENGTFRYEKCPA